jgi:hypothetical protein
MDRRQAFLLIAAIGLVPIALSYGVAPSKSLGYLFGLSVTTVDGTHIFRAVMGLYLALACFWVAGALKPHLTRAALWSLVVFMLGLAAGRVLSLMLDGWPHLLLVVYLLLELAFGAVGVMLLRAEPRQS